MSPLCGAGGHPGQAWTVWVICPALPVPTFDSKCSLLFQSSDTPSSSSPLNLPEAGSDMEEKVMGLELFYIVFSFLFFFINLLFHFLFIKPEQPVVEVKASISMAAQLLDSRAPPHSHNALGVLDSDSFPKCKWIVYFKTLSTH